MIKLNIQRFGHTNSTTNYELPQFVGTDKPQWLTDINQSYLAIDTAIHNAYALASLTSTNVGDISDLTTTVKTDVVSAVNEINGGLGDLSSTVASHTTAIGNNTTAIGNLADLDTVDKQDLVGAINEVDLIATNNATHIGTLSNLNTTEKTNLVGAINEVESDISKFNLSNSLTLNNPVSTQGCSYLDGSLTLMYDDSKTIFKLYGGLRLHLTSQGAGQVKATFNAPLNPDSDYTISPFCLIFNENGTVQAMGYVNINSNGTITIGAYLAGVNGENPWFYATPCLYFNKDFGDSPVNP